MHNEQTSLLENWYVVQATEKEFILYGHVYGDVKGRFDSGDFIHTSGIKNRKVEEGDTVITRNSLYLLGKKHDYT